jgi:ADP-ribosylglycohydrolase/protein-tyrosine phosphatase
MVILERTPDQKWKPVTVFQATPNRLFGKTLPGDPIREDNVAKILATQRRPVLDSITGEVGTMEDWIDYAVDAFSNGYTSWTFWLPPEKTIDMLYQREVLEVESRPMIRPDLRQKIEAPAVPEPKRSPVVWSPEDAPSSTARGVRRLATFRKLAQDRSQEEIGMELQDRLAGAVWGHLVGDAVGVPYEFKSPRQITSVHFGVAGTHGQPPGTWSDDGALMLACLDSLLHTHQPGEPVFDTADQAARFLAWRESNHYTPDGDPLFDIGGGTASGLARVKAGVSPEMAGGTDERNNGNGSLMRILPLALVERDISDAELVDVAHRSSAITHGHPDAQAACALYVLVARYLLRGSSRTDALAAALTSLRQVYGERTDGALRLASLDKLESWKGRSGRGYVIDSFWSAWDSFAGAGTYRETIERAIRYGNDTDTTACIAGGLAGIRFGRSGIPEHWLAKMRGAAIVDPLVARLTGSTPDVGGPFSTPLPAAAKSPPAGAKTSLNSEIKVCWVDLAEVPRLADAPGRIGMTFLPGKRDVGSAGIHWRDLEADATVLRVRHHVDVFVVLVEDHELVALGVPSLVRVLSDHGIEVIRMPLPDMKIPDAPAALHALLPDLLDRIGRGQRVVVACRGGLGRTGTVVACFLREAGLDGQAAIALTRKARHGTIQTRAQEQFVEDWAPVG